MGELFDKVIPTIPLSWTGERLTNGAGLQVEIEHVHRYFLARSLCRGLDVLDVASGEGYGAALLAQTAKSVIGVELSEEAVSHAQASYARPNLRFQCGDARSLPLPTGSVDVVVSFETIEHFYEHEVFLAEIKRVLRPGGRLVISSPERDVYSPAQATPNPYHVRELSRQELLTLLHKTFANVVLQGQRPMIGSALITENSNVLSGHMPTLTFERRGPDRFEVSEGLPRAVYLLAIASDAPINAIADSLYIETSDVEANIADAHVLRSEIQRITRALEEGITYSRHVETQLQNRNDDLERAEDIMVSMKAELSLALYRAETAEQHLASSHDELNLALGQAKDARIVRDRLASRLADLQADTHRTSHQIEAMRHKLNEAETNIAEAQKIEPYVRQLEATIREDRARFDAERASHRQALERILQSSSWKATAPFRSLVDRHPAVRRTIRRTAKLFWWTLTLQLPRRIRSRLAAPPAIKSQLLNVVPVGDSSQETLPTMPAVADPSGKAAVTATMQQALSLFLESGERIVFRKPERPEISVIVVLWNHAHFTLACLRALHTQIGPELEIILVDNASTDETSELLKRIDGVRVLQKEENVGFLRGCNDAAKIATGKAILLLNSDAFVRPGSIAAAYATLCQADNIGAVGARLVLPSGKLQEAGSIIWSNGTTYGYARDMDVEAGEAMFRRDVDYCSGAFLLIRRTAWDFLSGLDDIYAPAYYEETDFCMRLSASGYRIVYEPQAVVDHFEFGSESAPGEGINACEIRRDIFVSRFGTTLRQKHKLSSRENILFARCAANQDKPRLLVIDNDVPLTSLGSGYPRAREILIAADKLGWSVTLFPLHRLDIDWTAVRAEIPWEVEIISQSGAPRLANFLLERQDFYDAVMISRPENMALVRGILREHPGALDGSRLIYDAEALNAARDIAKATVEGKVLHAGDVGAMIATELALADSVDAITCVSVAEAKIFESRGVPIHILSHAVKCIDDTPSWSERAGILFVGRLLEKEAPNWQGLAWFIRDCWPLIRAALPRVRLSIAGHLHADHRELTGPGIRLLGPVTDLRPAYNAARLFISPTRFAAGVPLKILEAAASGLPVIGTTLMAKQLDWRIGTEIAAADDPQAFADAVIRLYRDEAAWNAMHKAGQMRVRRDHSHDVFLEQMRAILAGSKSPMISANPDDTENEQEPGLGGLEDKNWDRHHVLDLANAEPIF